MARLLGRSSRSRRVPHSTSGRGNDPLSLARTGVMAVQCARSHVDLVAQGATALALGSSDHPDAAASLREGLDDMFTVARLGITGTLAKTLTSTAGVLPSDLVRPTRRR